MFIKFFLYTALREQRGQQSILNCQANSLFFEELSNFNRVLVASQSPARSLLTIKIQNPANIIISFFYIVEKLNNFFEYMIFHWGNLHKIHYIFVLVSVYSDYCNGYGEIRSDYFAYWKWRSFEQETTTSLLWHHNRSRFNISCTCFWSLYIYGNCRGKYNQIYRLPPPPDSLVDTYLLRTVGALLIKFDIKTHITFGWKTFRGPKSIESTKFIDFF